MINKFRQYWKSRYGEQRIEKNLSEKDLQEIRAFIRAGEKAGKSSKQIIEAIRRSYPDTHERWQAERAYWTESKLMESEDIQENAEELDITKFRIVPSPRACTACREFSDNGNKIFEKDMLTVNGRTVPPIHPNCYCVTVPA